MADPIITSPSNQWLCASVLRILFSRHTTSYVAVSKHLASEAFGKQARQQTTNKQYLDMHIELLSAANNSTTISF